MESKIQYLHRKKFFVTLNIFLINIFVDD